MEKDICLFKNGIWRRTYIVRDDFWSTIVVLTIETVSVWEIHKLRFINILSLIFHKFEFVFYRSFTRLQPISGNGYFVFQKSTVVRYKYNLYTVHCTVYSLPIRVHNTLYKGLKQKQTFAQKCALAYSANFCADLCIFVRKWIFRTDNPEAKLVCF